MYQTATKVNWTKQYLLAAVPFIFFGVGRYIHKIETHRCIQFRDKSKLYGRELAPGEPPSWPVWCLGG